MNTFENTTDIKTLYISKFQFFQYHEEDLKVIEEIVIKAIHSSEGVYVYRHYSHLPEKGPLVKWIEKDSEVRLYKGAEITFTEEDIIKPIMAGRNEAVYYLSFNEENKARFLKDFKISIRSIKNRLKPNELASLLEKRLFIDDPLYDQYDFIFTQGDHVLLYTDIHDFSFIDTDI